MNKSNEPVKDVTYTRSQFKELLDWSMDRVLDRYKTEINFDVIRPEVFVIYIMTVMSEELIIKMFGIEPSTYDV